MKKKEEKLEKTIAKAKKKSISIVDEFKEFISRGNVIDLAVGIIIGSAFTAIVNSLVNDLLMPAIGILFGRMNFTDLKYVITAAQADTPEIAIYYGKFIQSILNFFLISIVIFIMIKLINNFRRKKGEKEDKPASPSLEAELLTAIRDILKK